MTKIIALVAACTAVLVFSGGPASARPDVGGPSVAGSHCPPTRC